MRGRQKKMKKDNAVVLGQAWDYRPLWLTIIATGAVEPLFKQNGYFVDV
jgi:hypothetical protein